MLYLTIQITAEIRFAAVFAKESAFLVLKTSLSEEQGAIFVYYCS